MATAKTVELPKTRDIPVWLAVLLILVCAGGGGYLAYKFLLGGSNEKIVLLERSPNETIREGRNPNTWWMQTQNPGRTNAGIEFDLAKPDKPILHYLIFRQDLSKEQKNLLSVGQNRWLDNDLHLTHDQQVKLNAMANAAHVPLPPPTADAMRNLFVQWKDTPPGKDKEDLENKLFSMLNDATQSLDAESKAKVLAKCEKVQAILTPEQLKTLESR